MKSLICIACFWFYFFLHHLLFSIFSPFFGIKSWRKHFFFTSVKQGYFKNIKSLTQISYMTSYSALVIWPNNLKLCFPNYIFGTVFGILIETCFFCIARKLSFGIFITSNQLQFRRKVFTEVAGHMLIMNFKKLDEMVTQFLWLPFVITTHLNFPV